MKYLKLFEMNNKSFIRIDLRTYTDSITAESVDDISTSDRRSIREIFGLEFYFQTNYQIRWELPSIECVILIYKDGKHLICAITKLKDEWFLVKYFPEASDEDYRFYKCDQIDGLVDCLNLIRQFISVPKYKHTWGRTYDQHRH